MTKQTTAAERRETFSKGLKLVTLPLKTSPAQLLVVNTPTSIKTPVDTKQESSTQQSVPARLNCKWELPSAVAEEVVSLSKRWAVELGQPAFDPDWDRIFWLERSNSIRVWTARTEGGILAGYLVVTILRGLFINNRFARVEAGYLAPEWREGFRGYRYIKSVVAEFKDMVIEWETNDLFEPDSNGRARLAKLLERLRFKQVGTVMRLG